MDTKIFVIIHEKGFLGDSLGKRTDKKRSNFQMPLKYNILSISQSVPYLIFQFRHKKNARVQLNIFILYNAAHGSRLRNKEFVPHSQQHETPVSPSFKRILSHPIPL